jgi:hypothetical protein
MSENISLLYNACCGGFSVSNRALELYNLRMKELNPIFTNIEYDFLLKRDDPVLIEIYYKCGSKIFGGRGTKIEIKLIEKKYLDFISYNEYDGSEDITIDYNHYKIFHITKIMLLNICNDEKINRIKYLI